MADRGVVTLKKTLKAKFHYASCSELVRSWFELKFGLSSSLNASSELARASRFAAKFHYAIWFEAGSKPVADQLRTR